MQLVFLLDKVVVFQSKVKVVMMELSCIKFRQVEVQLNLFDWIKSQTLSNHVVKDELFSA